MLMWDCCRLDEILELACDIKVGENEPIVIFCKRHCSQMPSCAPLLGAWFLWRCRRARDNELFLWFPIDRVVGHDKNMNADGASPLGAVPPINVGVDNNYNGWVPCKKLQD